MTGPEQRSADDPLAPLPDDLLDVRVDSAVAAEDDLDGAGDDAPEPAVVGPVDEPDARSGAAPARDGAAGPHAGTSGSVEELIADLERTSRERDEFLEALRRTQADFENYRKRIMKQQADDVARASGNLVEKLLPVLDACDGALRHGAAEVEPVFASLLGALEKEGLERIDPTGEEFDPTRHEAVMHEPAEDGDAVTRVSDVMRTGYAWKGRLVRPAMVKVRG